MRSSWKCIKNLSAKAENVGGLPGMVSVLHTFGSDMKFHLHVHSLITFGGVDESGKWHWPKRKKKLASYRDISKEFRNVFLKMLYKEMRKGTIIPPPDIESTLDIIESKRWNVKNGYPTVELPVLQHYLARYINRIAISKSRFEYLSEQKEVNIIHKHYKKKKEGEAAPLSIRSLEPIVAIDQFLRHILPPYFQKSRYYGLHASATLKKYKDRIDQKLLQNRDSISELFAVLKTLMKAAPYACEKCQSTNFQISEIKKNTVWIFYFITLPKLRGPPKASSYPKKASA